MSFLNKTLKLRNSMSPLQWRQYKLKVRLEARGFSLTIPPYPNGAMNGDDCNHYAYATDSQGRVYRLLWVYPYLFWICKPTFIPGRNEYCKKPGSRIHKRFDQLREELEKQIRDCYQLDADEPVNWEDLR